MKYKESAKGQLFEEGINEAGATSTFIASATSYSTHLYPTVPFYTFYSMFGFQRVADLIWSAADQRARGFLMGATSGRTTLNGEGLQHQDGHSPLMAHTNPAVRAWDPAFAYELATIIRHGIEEMYVDNQDVLHYIAIYNENYPMPAKPKGADEGIIKGMYLLRGAPKGDGPLVRLIGSGPIMVQVLDAVEKLETYGVRCEIYSATSYGELRREGLACDRHNRLHPTEEVQKPYVETLLAEPLPTVAVSDNMAAVPDMIRQWVSGPYTVLGTDGFGQSDTREALRRSSKSTVPPLRWLRCRRSCVKANSTPRSTPRRRKLRRLHRARRHRFALNRSVDVNAFVGLERAGGILVYDVSDPTAPVFDQYIYLPTT